MGRPRHVAVIDIGKTNAKLAIVDAATLRETAILSTPNRVLPGPPYPHFDTQGLWDFLTGALAGLNRDHPVDAISVTAHGASAALLDAQGSLALPVLDYEHAGPDELTLEYDAARPPFSQTGSPRLPLGLNLGAQVFWQFRRFPQAGARVAAILAYPQYWAFRLTGVRANEATSLGCHTDLWDPWNRRFSDLVSNAGWAPLMAPVRGPAEILGPLLPEIAARTGLRTGIPVCCGIHDSNASLYPHLLTRDAPFSVVSTGTWVISMAIGGKPASLDPSRDTLVNVNAFGNPVPSARFMGGREFVQLTQGRPAAANDGDIDSVIADNIMLLPAVENRSGPFQGRAQAWTVSEGELTDGQRFAGVSFYLANMTATCLGMIGADGPTVVEGPFAANTAYMRMLRAATARPVVRAGGNSTGTSIGASLLALGGQGAILAKPQPEPAIEYAAALANYASMWNRRANS